MFKQLIVAIAFTVGVFVVVNVIGDLAVQPQMAPQTTMMDEEPAEDMSETASQDTAEAVAEPAPETAATPDLLPTPETPRPMPEPQVTPEAVAEQAKDEMSEAAAAPAAEAVEDATEAAETAMAGAGDVENGSKIFRRKCKACHTAEKDGRNMTGPNLWGIVGRDRAAIEGFRYSTPMQALGGTWTEEDIKSFIAGPRTFLPDTKMTFAGLKTQSDREDVLAFLKTLQD